MPVSTHVYGSLISALATGKVNLSTDTLKVMLVSSGYVPNQAEDQFASTPAAFEITGTGYTAGGMALTDVTLAESGGHTLTLSAANTQWPGAIFTAAGAVVYDSQSGSNTTNPLIGFINFGGEQSPSGAVPFSINWASGVVLQFNTPTATVVAFDAVGTGGAASDASSASGTHTATAGAQVLAYVGAVSTASASSVTYGGAAMTLLGQVNYEGSSFAGTLSLFGLSDAPGGTQTVDVAFNAAAAAAFGTVSYTGVGSVGTPSTTSGAGTSPSQSLTCAEGQMISQAFGSQAVFTASSGGTRRFLGDNGSADGLVIQDSTASTTFTATSAASDPFAGIGVVLSP
jgi:hypothetical protein